MDIDFTVPIDEAFVVNMLKGDIGIFHLLLKAMESMSLDKCMDNMVSVYDT